MRGVLINFAFMCVLCVWAWFSDLGKAIFMGIAAGLYRFKFFRR